MQVDVIAVHNPVGEVRPLWILCDGKKLKIDKINSVIKLPKLTVFHCVINSRMAALQFTGAVWNLEWAD